METCPSFFALRAIPLFEILFGKSLDGFCASGVPVRECCDGFDKRLVVFRNGERECQHFEDPHQLSCHENRKPLEDPSQYRDRFIVVFLHQNRLRVELPGGENDIGKAPAELCERIVFGSAYRSPASQAKKDRPQNQKSFFHASLLLGR